MDYNALVQLYNDLETTAKRLEKTKILAKFLKNIKEKDIDKVLLLLQGKIFPNWSDKKIGVASRIIVKALHTSTGISVAEIEETWRTKGDLGLVVQSLVGIKKQTTLFSQKLSVSKVFSNLRKLASLEGSGTVDRKIQLLSELLTSSTPDESKYIVRTVLEEMRMGVGEGVLRDAIVWAFFGDKFLDDDDIRDREAYNLYSDAVQSAYDITNDFGEVFKVAMGKDIDALKNMPIRLGKPLKVMLALKVNSASEGFEKVNRPAQIEYKYDGMRMSIHKDNDTVTIFTRRLENVTMQFPEVVDYVRKNVKARTAILDSEAVGFDAKTNKYLAFQNISQRIRRKYGIGQLAKKMPVELNVFDILFYDGKSLINEPFARRRDIIKKIIDEKPKQIVIASSITTSDVEEVDSYFRKSVEAGNEGVMMKNLEAPYKPGGRVGYMVKLKSEQDALDLVIVEAEWGEGKRANMLSSYTLACIDEDGNFLEVGKASTGLKEKEGLTFNELTVRLKELIITEKGKLIKVKPSIVLEVGYEEIQKSPTYSSGYALRFPRIKNIREDRSPDDITTLDEIEHLYFEQKKA